MRSWEEKEEDGIWTFRRGRGNGEMPFLLSSLTFSIVRGVRGECDVSDDVDHVILRIRGDVHDIYKYRTLKIKGPVGIWSGILDIPPYVISFPLGPRFAALPQT